MPANLMEATMRTDKKTDTTSQTKPAVVEQLAESDLEKVCGGVTVTKLMDKSSPNLFLACCSGKHFS
jgi:type VI protein secretion system component Hcp